MRKRFGLAECRRKFLYTVDSDSVSFYQVDIGSTDSSFVGTYGVLQINQEYMLFHVLTSKIISIYRRPNHCFGEIIFLKSRRMMEHCYLCRRKTELHIKRKLARRYLFCVPEKDFKNRWGRDSLLWFGRTSLFRFCCWYFRTICFFWIWRKRQVIRRLMKMVNTVWFGELRIVRRRFTLSLRSNRLFESYSLRLYSWSDG